MVYVRGPGSAETQLALVAYAQHKDDISCGIVSVQGYVAGSATRDQQLAQLGLDRSANQWMILEGSKAPQNEWPGFGRQFWSPVQQELGQAIKIFKRACSELQRRHGRALLIQAFRRRGRRTGCPESFACM